VSLRHILVSHISNYIYITYAIVSCFLLFQRRHLNVLLDGLKSHDEFVCLFAKEFKAILDGCYSSIDMTSVNKVIELVHRMAHYIHKAAVRLLLTCFVHSFTSHCRYTAVGDNNLLYL